MLQKKKGGKVRTRIPGLPNYRRPCCEGLRRKEHTFVVGARIYPLFSACHFLFPLFFILLPGTWQGQISWFNFIIFSFLSELAFCHLKYRHVRVFRVHPFVSPSFPSWQKVHVEGVCGQSKRQPLTCVQASLMVLNCWSTGWSGSEGGGCLHHRDVGVGRGGVSQGDVYKVFSCSWKPGQLEEVLQCGNGSRAMASKFSSSS